MVFALKNVRVILLSEKYFVVYTDHQVLQTAFNKKDTYNSFAGYLDFKAEYDFEIKVRPGKANGAADYLSRRLIE